MPADRIVVSPELDIAGAINGAIAIVSAIGADLMTARSQIVTLQDKGGLGNWVTNKDVEVQARLEVELSTLGFGGLALAEESNSNPVEGTGVNGWVVDPIDGTTNFLHGFPTFSIAVALVLDGVVVAGIVHDPWLGETFAARLGAGAFLNGKPIEPSAARTLSQALVATGRPYPAEMQLNFVQLVTALTGAVGGIRIKGPASLDICYVACGRLDGYAELNLAPWDFAAANLIAVEAGAAITRFDGEPVGLATGSVLAAAPELYGKLRRLVGGCVPAGHR